MSIGFGQICLVGFILLLLFGNIPNIIKDLKNSLIFLKKPLSIEKQKSNKIVRKKRKSKKFK
jgi:Sec-independent protein translocase protein TatA